MERIWAPWRIEYILAGEKKGGCIFCVEDAGPDRERLLLHRSRHCFVMLNRYPYTNGHLMVIPYLHTSTMNDMGEDELLDLMLTVRLSHQVLEEASSPQGFNVGMNLGKAAGAGVDEHLHVHIVPRWNGDTNFMSVTADARVVPESLLATFDRLKPLFERLQGVSSQP
jgi:ATP adenylyltransferase